MRGGGVLMVVVGEGGGSMSMSLEEFKAQVFVKVTVHDKVSVHDTVQGREGEWDEPHQSSSGFVTSTHNVVGFVLFLISNTTQKAP